MNIDLAVFAGVSSMAFAVFWVFVWRKWDREKPDPFWAMGLAMVCGALSAGLILVFFETDVFLKLELDLGDGIALLLFLVLIEELVKFFAFRLGMKFYRDQVDQMVDGLLYGASTGLGFAIVENAIYFYNYNLDAILVIFRSLETMFLHTLLTGLFGIYFVIAYNPMHFKYKKLPIAERKAMHSTEILRDFFHALTFHITRRHILNLRKSSHRHRHTEVIFEGLWLVLIFHGLHNLAAVYKPLGFDVSILMIVIVVLLAWFVMSLFDQKWYLKGVGKL
ncbi:PrsW family intramembrane metalloprotease [Patescibacteria group bacterium]|nr:PrsW family intramembrane metalloprotease [Patescibacteria group bacterium]